MDVFGVLTLFGGIALFLFGMRMMGEGIEKRAGSQMRIILEKLTSNPVKGILLGAAVTAIIQSSAATTVMVVGFVNSNIMNLSQATGVIMGANLGTTITAWILSLSGIQGESIFVQLLKPSSFSPILALIGVALQMFSKSNKKRDAGTIMLGFAILMFGMQTMSGSVAPLADIPEFTQFLTLFESPLLGVVTGAIITAIIQSSSASVGILQALSLTGSITFSSAIPIILGMNIGACIITMISAFGTSRNARRTALFHLYFSLIGKVLVTAVFMVADAIFHFSFMDLATTPITIAIAHSALNLISIIVVLPFVKQLERLVCLTIKDGPAEQEQAVLLDERFMATPGLAVDRSRALTQDMAEYCAGMFRDALTLIRKFDPKTVRTIADAEAKVDMYEDRIGTYLVELSARSLTQTDNREAQKILHAIGDFERIADHAVNIAESCGEMHEKGLVFSASALDQLDIIIAAVTEVLDLTMRAFFTNDPELAARVEPLEDIVDDLRAELKTQHIERLQRGSCTIELGFIFSDLLTNFERISDHCSNIAAYVIQTAMHTMAPHEYMHVLKDSDNARYEEMRQEYLQKYRLD